MEETEQVHLWIAFVGLGDRYLANFAASRQWLRHWAGERFGTCLAISVQFFFPWHACHALRRAASCEHA